MDSYRMLSNIRVLQPFVMIFYIHMIFMKFNSKGDHLREFNNLLGLHRWSLIYGGERLNFEFRTGIIGHKETKKVLRPLLI
jgi:hypothetical protein